MIEMLMRYSKDEITDGFKNWLAVGKSVPVPADIIEIIIASRTKKREVPIYLDAPKELKMLTDEKTTERVQKGFKELLESLRRKDHGKFD